MLPKKQPSIEEKNKNSVEVLTFLGAGTEFRGNVLFKGTLRVDGLIDGEIEGTDTLILGEQGCINGICRVAKAILSGRFTGEIHAAEKVTLKNNADIEGKILTPILHIEEGALFNGTCKMTRAAAPISMDRSSILMSD